MSKPTQLARSKVAALCAEFDIEIIDRHRVPQPGETRAVVTLTRIMDRHGEGHLRLVLSTLTETEGAGGIIDETSAWAVSDLIRACPEWVEERAGEWLEAWDKLPLGRFMATIQNITGITHKRHALAGVCYIFLTATLTEPEPPVRRGHLSDDEKIAIGLDLLAKKDELPRGHFGPWLKAEAGVSVHIAHQCMRRAREAGEASEASVMEPV